MRIYSLRFYHYVSLVTTVQRVTEVQVIRRREFIRATHTHTHTHTRLVLDSKFNYYDDITIPNICTIPQFDN